jgi:hypothetical protein
VTSDIPISLGGKDRARKCHSDWLYQTDERSGKSQAKWTCLSMGIAVGWADWVMLSLQDLLMPTISWQEEGFVLYSLGGNTYFLFAPKIWSKTKWNRLKQAR